jgi:hypothetical protein
VTHARLVSLSIVILAGAAFAHAGGFKSRFSFKVPEGWIEKSQPETRNLVTVAFDAPNDLVFQAKVRPGAEPITPEFLDKYAALAQESVKKRATAGELKVISKLLLKVGDTIAARFVFEMTPPPDVENPQVVRQLVVYIPTVDQSATLTFSAPAATYEKFEPLFDKTARSTLIRK